MGIIEEIAKLIKNRVIIRHRNNEELPGDESLCMICNRKIVLPPGSLCLVVDDEGLLCPRCGSMYAPDMVALMNGQLPSVVDANALPFVIVNNNSQMLSREECIEIIETMESLSEVCDKLSRGVARGIVEAPAGHIGLMHYAKDLRKPEQRENESVKDYELRVKSYRIVWLYEKIHADTSGKAENVIQMIRNKLITEGHQSNLH